jgi:hypothetical protein
MDPVRNPAVCDCSITNVKDLEKPYTLCHGIEPNPPGINTFVISVLDNSDNAVLMVVCNYYVLFGLFRNVIYALNAPIPKVSYIDRDICMQRALILKYVL